MSTTLSITSLQFAPSTRIESHELGAERLHGVRAGIPERRGEPQAVPAAREPGRRRAGLDGPDPVPVTHRSSMLRAGSRDSQVPATGPGLRLMTRLEHVLV